MGPLITLAVAGAYSVVCILVGMAGFRFLGSDDARDKSLMRLGLGSAFALGQGVLAIIWMLIGLAGFFDRRWIVCVLLAGAVTGALPFVRRDTRRILFRQLTPKLVRSVSAFPTPLLPAVIALVAMVVVVGIFNGLLPPRFGVGDGFFYYLVFPKTMAASHRIAPVSGYESSHSVLGYQGEMHHAVLFSLAGENAAMLFVWVTMLGVFALLLRLCEDLGLRPVGKLAALVALFSSTAFNFFLTDGKVDTYALLFGMAAFLWTLRALDSPVFAPRLAGLFTGLAIVAKLTFAYSVAIPVISILIVTLLKEKDARDERSSGTRLFWRLAGILSRFSLFCALPIMTHMFKNAVMFREPLAPLVFLNQPISVTSNYSWNSPDTAKQLLWALPYSLVYGKYSVGHLSPLFLAALPIAVMAPKSIWRTYSRAVTLAIVGVVALLVGAWAEASFFTVRFLLPAAVLVLPMLGLLFQTAVEAWVAHFASLVAIAVALCTVMLGYSQVGHDWQRMVRYRFQGADVCEFDTVPWFPSSMCKSLISLNELASPGDRILHHGYSYWLRPDLIQCMPTRDEWNWISAASTAHDEWSRIHALGFRFIVTDRELQPTPDWLSVSRINLESEVQVYELKSLNLGLKPQFACRQLQEPAWDVIAVSDRT